MNCQGVGGEVALVAGASTGIEPFRIELPKRDLADLRARIHSTRLPAPESFVGELRDFFRTLR